jgi:hypothetical protein
LNKKKAHTNNSTRLPAKYDQRKPNMPPAQAVIVFAATPPTWKLVDHTPITVPRSPR